MVSLLGNLDNSLTGAPEEVEPCRAVVQRAPEDGARGLVRSEDTCMSAMFQLSAHPRAPSRYRQKHPRGRDTTRSRAREK